MESKKDKKIKKNKKNKDKEKELDLLINKYKILTYNDYQNNKMIKNNFLMEKLIKISQDKELPHIIFYGNEGSGKKTFINIFLNMIYGDDIYNLRTRIFKVPKSSGKVEDIYVLESNYHIIIKPNGNNFDRYMIPKIVKDYTFISPLYMYEEKQVFKTILIEKADTLSLTSQSCLRRIIEKHSKNYRFIIWCNNISRISEPLKSRCLCIHVPYYSNNELLKWSNNICIKYDRQINKKILQNIINKSNKNLKNILLGIDLYHYKNKLNTTYDDTIKNICNNLFLKKINIRNLRDNIYSLTSIISYNKIFKDLTLNILNKIKDDNIKNKIINNVSNYELSLTKARRPIIHIEAYLIFIYTIINNS